MRPTRAILIISCAALAAALLTGCSKKPAETSTTQITTTTTTTSSSAAVQPNLPTAPAATPGGPMTTITADQLPAPKAGLWQRISQQDSDPPSTDTKCMTGKPLNPMADGPPCAHVDIRRTSTGGFVLDANCPANGVTAKLHTAAEGDFNSAYTADSTMTMSQAGTPDNAMKNHSAYKYLGPCKAG